MPIFAIVIKRGNGNWLVKFKKARSGERLEKVVKERLKPTGHTLVAINYISPDPEIYYDRPYKKRKKTIDNVKNI